MGKKYKRAIVWFKRDLRVEDNEALHNACFLAEEVIPVFIFIPSLLERFGRRKDRLGFIVSALRKLDEDLRELGGKLYVFCGEPDEVFPYIIKDISGSGCFHKQSPILSWRRIRKKSKSLLKVPWG
jgi:deoxyribodipyrimidine photo-lyase